MTRERAASEQPRKRQKAAQVYAVEIRYGLTSESSAIRATLHLPSQGQGLVLDRELHWPVRVCVTTDSLQQHHIPMSFFSLFFLTLGLSFYLGQRSGS